MCVCGQAGRAGREQGGRAGGRAPVLPGTPRRPTESSGQQPWKVTLTATVIRPIIFGPGCGQAPFVQKIFLARDARAVKFALAFVTVGTFVITIPSLYYGLLAATEFPAEQVCLTDRMTHRSLAAHSSPLMCGPRGRFLALCISCFGCIVSAHPHTIAVVFVVKARFKPKHLRANSTGGGSHPQVPAYPLTVGKLMNENGFAYGTFRLNFQRFDRFELDLRGHTQP